jgi:hypothetical protein
MNMNNISKISNKKSNKLNNNENIINTDQNI